ERIDVRSRAVFRDEPDATADLDVTVRIVGIGDRKRDGRVFLQVARFDSSLRGVHPNETILVIAPDRRHLRRSIRHECSQIRKRLLPLKQVEISFGNDCHGTDLFGEDSARRTKAHPATWAFLAVISDRSMLESCGSLAAGMNEEGLPWRAALPLSSRDP